MMQSRGWLCLTLLLSLAWLVAGCAEAGGTLRFADQTERLERARIEAAAAPLLARGAIVSVIVVEEGDASGQDHQRRLEEAQLLSGELVRPEVIAVYVSYTPRFSELRVGSRWNMTLNDSALDEIRLGTLNPALRSDDPTGAIDATLAAFDARLGRPTWLIYPGAALAAIGLGAAWWEWRRRRRRAARMRQQRLAPAKTPYAELIDVAQNAHDMVAALDGRKGNAKARARVRAEAEELKQRRRALTHGRQPEQIDPSALAELTEAYRSLTWRARRLIPRYAASSYSSSTDSSSSYSTDSSSSSSSSDSTSSYSTDSSSSYSSDSSSSSSESSSSGSW